MKMVGVRRQSLLNRDHSVMGSAAVGAKRGQVMEETISQSISAGANRISTQPISGTNTTARVAAHTYFLNTTEQSDLDVLPDGQVQDLVNFARVNDVAHLNDFFAAINQKLSMGGLYTGCVQPSSCVKQQILSTYPYGVSWAYYLLFLIVKRILPKMKVTRRVYAFMTGGKGWVLSKTEVLGRLVYSGFEIRDCRKIREELYYTVQKVQPPKHGRAPSYGLIFTMRRVGKDGRPISIYKVRTMHDYAEYLQAYIHAKNNLQPNGKFKDDFRITAWGKFLRKTWIDELPMLVNWVKGDIKLVGVRPISEQYLSLYPEDMVKRRLRHKPGLLPPFYADLPTGFDAILASEAKYMEAWEKYPFRTDMRYLVQILYNIIVRRARSQ